MFFKLLDSWLAGGIDLSAHKCSEEGGENHKGIKEIPLTSFSLLVSPEWGIDTNMLVVEVQP